MIDSFWKVFRVWCQFYEQSCDMCCDFPYLFSFLFGLFSWNSLCLCETKQAGYDGLIVRKFPFFFLNCFWRWFLWQKSGPIESKLFRHSQKFQWSVFLFFVCSKKYASLIFRNICLLKNLDLLGLKSFVVFVASVILLMVLAWLGYSFSFWFKLGYSFILSCSFFLFVKYLVFLIVHKM